MMRIWILPVVLELTGVSACSDLSGLAGKQSLPAGTLDPNAVKTETGAMSLYQAEVAAFQYSNGTSTPEIGSGTSTTGLGAFVNYVMLSGQFADELQDPCASPTRVETIGTCETRATLDARQVWNEGTSAGNERRGYALLQGIRNGANLATGALAAYATNASPALRGQMFALKGYAEVLLADLYCSGIPLSTVDFNGDFTYHAGSTTDQVYRDAVAQFDTAISLSGDSSRILNLARVGKGRALLARGLLDSAAAVVAAVPDGFTYQFLVDWTTFNGGTGTVFPFAIAVANAEGKNGLPYRTDGAADPRVTTKQYGVNEYNMPLYAPAKYGSATSPFTGTIASITVADWIEARLIRAEAALAATPDDLTGWLGQLNYLRAHAIAPALPALSDPIDPRARLSLLFKERAYWLFVTGHRQGDMRRLVRQYGASYGFDVDHVYPVGPYLFGTDATVYGPDVSLPIPADEFTNPLYTGCLSAGA